MAKSVDQKVVQMQFDNQNFEQNAKQTMSTLDKLKAALKFDGANKGAEDLAKGIKNVGTDFSQCEIMATKAGFHIQDVWLKLSNVLEYQIARKIINLGENMLKSLSLDQVTAGFGEYELKMGSVQTIMASTGEELSVVSKYLEDLNHYADKTIYSFSDMTQNIGKFTNAGVNLKDAVAAIQGVANVAAVSGANANEASRAMYNFAQALSAGYVKLIDWKSIENANMATVEFKNTLLQTAVAMKTVKDNGDGTYKVLTKNMQGKAMDGAISATKNFNESLNYQWMTTKVLNQALEVYSKNIEEMTPKERELYEEELKRKGFTEEQIKAFEELGVKASKAATEVKTFSQLMDTIKEAIGSGWAMSFEHIIGNFNEAKALFTEINDIAGKVISEIDDRRNTLLNNWKQQGGRDLLIQSFRNIAEAIGQVISVAKKLWYDLFPPTTSKNLVELTRGFEQFTRSLIMNEDTANSLRETLHYLLTPIKILIELVKVAFKLIVPITSALMPIAKIIITLTSTLAKIVVILGQAVVQSQAFQNILSKIKSVISGAFNAVKSFATTIGTSFVNALKNSNSWLNKFIQSLVFLGKISLAGISAALNSIANFKFSNVTAGIERMKTRLVEFVNGLRDMAKDSKAIQILVEVIDKLKSGFEFLYEAFSAFATSFAEGMENVHSFSDFLGVLKDSFENAFKPIINFFKDKIFGDTGNVFDNLKTSFQGFVDVITEGAKKIPWSKVILVAFCVGLAAAVLQLVNAISKFSILASALGESIRIVNETVKRFTGIRNRLIELKEIAIFIASIAFSLGIIASFPKEDILRATAILGSLAGGLMVLAEAMMFINKKALLKPAAMSQLFLSLAGLAAGAMALTAAIIALSDLKKTISELLPYIAELGIVMLELIGAMTILSVIGKKLQFSLSAFSALSLVAFAGSVYLLCKALKELEDINFADIDGLVKVLISVLGGFAVITALTKKLGFWSFASLIAIMVGLKNLAPTIEELAQIHITDDVKHILELVTQIVTIISIVSMVTTVYTSLVKILRPKQKIFKTGSTLLGDFSRSLLAIGISVTIMTLAITNLINALDNIKHVERIKMSLVAAGIIVAGLGVFIVKVSQGGKIFTSHKGSMLKFAAGVALLSTTIIPLVFCVEEICRFVDSNQYSTGQIIAAGAIVSALIGLIGILAAFSSKCAGVNFKTLLAIFGGLAVIFGEIMGFTLIIDVNKGDELGKAIGVLLAVLVSLDGALFFLSKMKFDAVNAGVILAFTGTLALLFGGVIAASLLIDDTDRLATVIKDFFAVTATITLGLIGLSKACKGISWTGIAAFAVMLIGFVSSFLIVSKNLEGIDWDGMRNAGISFLAVVVILVAACKALDGVNNAGSVATLLALSGSIIALAGALYLLRDIDANHIADILNAMATFEIVMAGLAGLVGALDYVYGIGAALQAALLVLSAFTAALALLTGAAALLAHVIAKDVIPALITLCENADVVSEGIQKLSNAVSNGMQIITQTISRSIVVISTAISVGLANIISNTASEIAQGCVVIGIGIGAGIEAIFQTIFGIITGKYPSLKQHGTDSGTNFKDGLLSTEGLITTAASGLIGVLLSTLGGFGGSFFAIGASLFKALISGFGEGSDSQKYTEQTVSNVIYGAQNSMSGTVKTLAADNAKQAKAYSYTAQHEMEKAKGNWKAANNYKLQNTKEVNIKIEAEEKSIWNTITDVWRKGTSGIGKDTELFGIKMGNVWDTLKTAGTGAWEAITGWMDPSKWMGDALNFEDMIKDVTAGMENAGAAAGVAGDGMEDMGKKAKKGAKGVKEAKDEIESFVEKIEGSFNILDEFDLGMDEENPLTGDKLLDNMRSNVEGMTQWSNEMVGLAGKMTTGLYKKLADMGPSGYKYVHAFAQMTTEQLDQVNQYYAQSLIIPAAVTAQVYQGMYTTASNAYTGFVNGLNVPEMQKIGVDCATFFLTGITGASGFDTHSPSKKTFQIGIYVTEGLSNGMKDPSAKEGLMYTIRNMCREIIEAFRLGLSADNFKDIGQQVLRGLNNGITSKNPDVLKSITNLCDAIEHRARTTLQINSPSKVFAKIGAGIPEGMAKGITDNVTMVESSTQKMAEATVENMRGAISTIQAIVDSDMDVEPVIRPVVDLSDVTSGASTLNSLMNTSFGTGITMPQANFMTSSQLISNTDNSNVVEAIGSLQEDIANLKDAMTNIKMVLDTGTMVGAMTPAIDQQLGRNMIYAGRGI